MDPSLQADKAKGSAAVHTTGGGATDRVTAAPVSLVLTKGQALTEEQRLQYIRTAAYHLAEKRGFEPGHADEDWTAAVAQIDALRSAEL
jgi:hypothetical protein